MIHTTPDVQPSPLPQPEAPQISVAADAGAGSGSDPDEVGLGDAEEDGASQRTRKLRDLRKRMNESARANRKDVVEEARRSHTSARESARLARKRIRAEALGEKAAAVESGEDLERTRAWGYSIEDNDNWEKKLKRKRARADFEFTDYDDMARRKYKKDVDALRPDLVAYNRQRALEEGQATAEGAAIRSPTQVGDLQSGGGDFYRDLRSLAYADHRPSDDAIDRVVGKINADIDKRNKHSRTRAEEDGDITYINDKNKIFNRKIARYYDKYTAETRANFERGTAL